jgi:hypothetical protein
VRRHSITRWANFEEWVHRKSVQFGLGILIRAPGDAIRLGETDRTRFSDTTYGGGTLRFDSSSGTVITSGVSKGERIVATGTAAEPTTVTVAKPVGATIITTAVAHSTIHVN